MTCQLDGCMHVGSPVDDQVIEVVEIPRAQMARKAVELRRPGFWLTRSENHQARRERREREVQCPTPQDLRPSIGLQEGPSTHQRTSLLVVETGARVAARAVARARRRAP